MEDIGDGSGVPEVIVELDQYSAQMNGEDDVCMENLKVVSLLEPFYQYLRFSIGCSYLYLASNK